MTGSSHKTFPGPQGGFLLSSSKDPIVQRKLNNAIFPELVPHTIYITLLVKLSLLLSSRNMVNICKRYRSQRTSIRPMFAQEGFDVLAEGEITPLTKF